MADPKTVFTVCTTAAQARAVNLMAPTLRAAGFEPMVGITPRLTRWPIAAWLADRALDSIDLEQGLEGRMEENIRANLPPLLFKDMVDVAVTNARPVLARARALLLMDGKRIGQGLADEARRLSLPVIAQQCQIYPRARPLLIPEQVVRWQRLFPILRWRPHSAASCLSALEADVTLLAKIAADRTLLAGPEDRTLFRFIAGRRDRIRLAGLPGISPDAIPTQVPEAVVARRDTILFLDDAPVCRNMMDFADWERDIIPLLRALILFHPLFKIHPDGTPDIERLLRTSFPGVFTFLDRSPLTDEDWETIGLVITGASTGYLEALSRGIPVVFCRLPGQSRQVPAIAHPLVRVVETPEALRNLLRRYQSDGVLAPDAPCPGSGALTDVLASGDAAVALRDALLEVSSEEPRKTCP